MKEEIKPLKVFSLSSFLTSTEIFSLLGNKYAGSLPFKIELTNDWEVSNLVLWDGIITQKNQSSVSKIMETLGPSRRVLLLSDSRSLWMNHPQVKMAELNPEFFDELNSWTVLPEEILYAFENSYKKLTHA